MIKRLFFRSFYTTRFLLASWVVLWCLLLPGAQANAQPEILDRVVAIVGTESILLSELNAEVEFYAFNMHVDPTTPGLAAKTLDALIDQKLILTKAQEDTTLSITEDEVDRSLEGMIQQRIQQAGGEKRLEEIYGMTVGRMRREWRDDMRKYLLADRLTKKKTSDVQSSRREVEEFFALYKDSLPPVKEELELYHIYQVPVISEDVRNHARELAGRVLDSIKQGGDFASFARRYSIDQGSGSNGGDLGWVHRGEFVKEFEEAAFALKDSQYADLVETKFGLHIIQLLERRGDAVHARHILLKMERDSSSTLKTINFLKSIKESVAAGQSFTELAKKYSEDKESASLGGLIGKYTVDQFDDALLREIASVKAGEISDPLPVSDGNTQGYHNIWVKERIPGHAMSLEQDWKRLEQLSVAYKSNQVYREWLKQLRDEIFWESRL